MKKLNLIEGAEEYFKLLNSGMFWEFYPQLSGDWIKDKNEWELIYKQLKQSRECQTKN